MRKLIGFAMFSVGTMSIANGAHASDQKYCRVASPSAWMDVLCQFKDLAQSIIDRYPNDPPELVRRKVLDAIREQEFPNRARLSGGISDSCKVDQGALIARMNRLQSSPPAGICANARAAHPIHVDMANFYARCPSADPSGQMRQMALENIRITKQQMEASCAN